MGQRKFCDAKLLVLTSLLAFFLFSRKPATMQTCQQALRITLVDDDPSVTPILEHYLLQDLGSKVIVRSFDDARRAEFSLQAEGCDLLISDIEMPQLDGPALFDIAKSTNAWTQVIYMTAHSTWERLTQAMAKGASNYLLKPVLRDDLFEVICIECERHRRWQQAVLATVVGAHR